MCATGISHSVKDLVVYVFDKLGLNWEEYVSVDKKYFRPEELKDLKGDSSKARKILGWNHDYTFETMLDEMIEYWMNHFKNVNPPKN